jgi:hypothetical protein
VFTFKVQLSGEKHKNEKQKEYFERKSLLTKPGIFGDHWNMMSILIG